ncbi:MAG: exosome complex protein Rrp42 [Conexivisphaera sp.]
MSITRRNFVVERLRKEKLKELLAKGQRLDGRGLKDYRPLSIRTSIISKAEGSAQVYLGNTAVIAGVKASLDKPYRDTPDRGNLIVNAEILPLASPYIEPGPPNENAIELARVVDRGIRESGMVDLSKLVVKVGELVYSIFVDINVLNVDGNLFDAASYAAVAALATSRVPEYRLDEGGNPVQTGNLMALPLTGIPVSVTAVKIGDYVLYDPTEEEEAVMDTRLTMTFTEDGICALQKGGSGGWSPAEVVGLVEESFAKAKEIREQIRRGLGLGGQGEAAQGTGS